MKQGWLWRGGRAGDVLGAWCIVMLVLCSGCPFAFVPDGNGGDGGNDPCVPTDTKSAGIASRAQVPHRAYRKSPSGADKTDHLRSGKSAAQSQLADPGFEDGNVDEGVTSPLGKTSGEPNDRFDNPVVAVFSPARTAALKGMVARRGDLDVYLLGALEVGDHVVVDARAANGSVVDVSIALFDAEERLVNTNDDRTPDDLDALIEHTVRHRGDRYYLVVTHAAFATRGTFTGSYLVDISVDGDRSIPPPGRQVLFLDFDGGPITSPNLPQLAGGVVPPFDACAIDEVYRGETAAMIQAIVDTVTSNYRNFDVVVRSNEDPPRGNETTFTTMLFGGFRNGIFGIAEDIDVYNANRCDDGIIFTETFQLSFFSFTPTVEEMGVAIGNVAAHEAGHLLGLNHVDNDADLMDDTSPADVFVTDQEFLNSPLSSDIMSIGTQDSVLLLNQTVGPVR